jgi:hypothetical protein
MPGLDLAGQGQVINGGLDDWKTGAMKKITDSGSGKESKNELSDEKTAKPGAGKGGNPARCEWF